MDNHPITVGEFGSLLNKRVLIEIGKEGGAENGDGSDDNNDEDDDPNTIDNFLHMNGDDHSSDENHFHFNRYAVHETGAV